MGIGVWPIAVRKPAEALRMIRGQLRRQHGVGLMRRQRKQQEGDDERHHRGQRGKGSHGKAAWRGRRGMFAREGFAAGAETGRQ